LVVYPIELPPLRARRDDIPLLVGHFLRKLESDVGRKITRVCPDALEALARHGWPGNVRELQNVVHRSLLACAGDEITLADLPPDIRALSLPSLPPAALGDGESENDDEQPIIPLRELERRAIERALKQTNGSVAQAAKLLGIGRATLYRRLATLELPSVA
jgi:DNA-binding NtrC family response regulator